MIQTIPRSNLLGETLERSMAPLGTGMAQGISTGLQALANMKLQQIQQRNQQQRTAQGLQALFPNMSPEQSQAFAQLDPQSLNVVLKQKLQEPERLEFGRMGQQLLNQGQMQQGQPVEAGAQPQMQGGLGAMGQFGQGLQGAPQLSGQQFMQLATLAQGQQKIAQRERQMQQQFGLAKEEQIKKSFDSQRKELEKAHQVESATEQEIKNLNNAITLVKSGNVNLGKYQSTLEKYGLDQFFTTPATDAVRRYLAVSSQGAAADYGSAKLSNKIVDFEAKTSPLLSNTKEGFIVNAKNQILRRKASNIVAKEVRRLENDAMRRNKPLPYDVRSLASENIEPQLKKLANKEAENNIEALENIGASPLPKGKEGEEGYLPDVPGIKWSFSKGKWHAEMIEEEV